MTMAELVELVYKLISREYLSAFFPPVFQVRRSGIGHRIIEPGLGYAFAEGGVRPSRKATRIRGIPDRAGRVHR